MDFSAGALFASLVVSAVGLGIFVYGKRERRVPQVLGGLALMVLPYFTGGPWPTLGVGAAVGVGIWLAVRAGW